MTLIHGANAARALRELRLDDAGRAFANPAADATADQSYFSNPGNHGSTARWTYTVPAGKVAILEATWLYTDPVPDANNIGAQVTVNRAAGGAKVIADLRNGTTEPKAQTDSVQLVLRAGDQVIGVTFNSTASNYYIGVNAFVREISL